MASSAVGAILCELSELVTLLLRILEVAGGFGRHCMGVLCGDQATFFSHMCRIFDNSIFLDPEEYLREYVRCGLMRLQFVHDFKALSLSAAGRIGYLSWLEHSKNFMNCWRVCKAPACRVICGYESFLIIRGAWREISAFSGIRTADRQAQGRQRSCGGMTVRRSRLIRRAKASEIAQSCAVIIGHPSSLRQAVRYFWPGSTEAATSG
jgi:hypothetical protein